MEKRRGYKDIKKQIEADKRYLAKHPEAKEKKKISAMKSNAKRFIKEFAKKEELDDFQVLIKERKGEIKMLENLRKKFVGSYDEVALAIAHSINFYLRDNNIKFKDLEVEDNFIRLTIDKSNIYIFDLEKEEKIQNIYCYTVVDVFKQQI